MHQLALLMFSCLATLGYAAPTSIEDSIQSRALRGAPIEPIGVGPVVLIAPPPSADSIDLSILYEAPEALADIADIYQSNGVDYSQFYRNRDVKPVLRRGVGNIIDVHCEFPSLFSPLFPPLLEIFLTNLPTPQPTPSTPGIVSSPPTLGGCKKTTETGAATQCPPGTSPRTSTS